MVINLDETKLRTIAQLQEFLDATPEIGFTGAPDNGDVQRYEHISGVLGRFDYPRARQARTRPWCWPTCAAPAATAARRSPA